MAERKVLSKYYPPDFDPSIIPRRSGVKNGQHKVRLMAPFSMQCVTCGEYIYKGKKFNARKETVHGEMYLTIKIFRFYIRCPKCSAELTFKTDPKNADYVAENGCTRNFEPWRDLTQEKEDRLKEREIDEMNNPLKALENRTLDSKREMEIADSLDEIRTRNARNDRIDAESVLLRLEEENAHNSEEEDEAEAKKIFEQNLEKSNKTKKIQHSLEQEDEVEEEVSIDKVISHTGNEVTDWSLKKEPASNGDKAKNMFGIVKKPKAEAPKPVESSTNSISLLGDYGSSSEDED
ncbi:DUF572-domain-containing protein [Conidiobolus coronatus NRRL 28638]|uniref:Splicing factor YJU2 n=1 Tax=Conidiobolus coronatus (strain ATCC 28846 / CBS 209.66 / NRRL 28638) TaxID=796925 RepID=A0A137NVN1_CONC2|nr:DUF572-domain-containing protein [Conidiobolus coronatus NRRL 28638]|eukprot:KXN66895.1 DUF572-domain-containing protein [Conidiobolus coronatus NRRL 28638]